MNDADAISASEKEAAVARILASDGFLRLKRARLILSFLFDHYQENGASVTQYDIASKVFGRDRDFSADIDSLVRVQVSRLRSSLADYYQQDGVQDPIGITIPKGTYELNFFRRDLGPDEPVVQDVEIDRGVDRLGKVFGLGGVLSFSRLLRTNGLVLLFLCVLILTILLVETNLIPVWKRGVSGDQNRMNAENFAITLAQCGRPSESNKAEHTEQVSFVVSALMGRLSRSKRISVVSETRDEGDYSQRGPQYCFDVKIRAVAKEKLLSVRLVDIETDRLVWARNVWTVDPIVQKSSTALMDQLASSLRREIYSETANKAEAKKTANTAEELFLRATFVPGRLESNLAWNLQRVALAQQALALDPKFAPAHSVLADKMAYILRFVESESLPFDLADSVFHAEKALEFGRGDPDVVFNVALHSAHIGELQRAKDLLGRVLQLAPHRVAASLLLRIPLCRRPSAAVVSEINKIDRELDSGEPIRWIIKFMLARAHLIEGELDKAFILSSKGAAMSQVPLVTLQKAAILASLGKVKEARNELANLRQRWPSLSLDKYVKKTIGTQCADGDNIAKKNRLGAYQKLLSIAVK